MNLPKTTRVSPTDLELGRALVLPATVEAAGSKASHEFLTFFAGTLRNPNTRAAYARAWNRFDTWCTDNAITSLIDIDALVVSAYIESLCQTMAPASVKQHRAALSKTFDFLVVRQIVPANPVANVSGPKVQISKGSTPVLSDDEFLTLIESIPSDTLIGLRDRAFICLLTYTWPRVSSAINLQVKDYYSVGKRWYVDLVEKGGKSTSKLTHHRTQDALDAYLQALMPTSDDPIFQSFDRHRRPTGKAIGRRNALDMVKRRARAAGLARADQICNHSFRATGITNYMGNGGRIDVAQEWASHSDPRTTSLYDRSVDKVSVEEVERIRFERGE